MFLKNKNILLISPESWDHLFVSKHHYSIALAARGNRVFFLNPPGKRYDIAHTSYANVWQLTYPPFIKGLRFLPAFVQRILFRKKFEALQKTAATKFDVVWSFDNSVFFDFSFLTERTLSICHIVDYSQNFRFGRAARTADICFGVSANIVDRLKLYNPNSLRIPHGYASGIHIDQSVAVPGSRSVKALYTGNLESLYLDKEAFVRLTDAFPGVDFIFAGSGNWSLKKDNVFFLGRIDRKYLMNYLQKADILLLFYDFDRYPDQITNAHKILEYLAAGPVIVSNYLPDYEKYGELLLTYRNKENLLALFDQALRNLPALNNSENKRRRKEFALSNTYEHRISEIEQHIFNTQKSAT